MRPWLRTTFTRRQALALVLALVLAAPLQGHAQGQVDAATRSQVIARVIALMDERYVFPEVAREAASALRDPARLQALQTDDAGAFARGLTELLQSTTRDKHLRVTHSATPVPEPRHDRPADADVARFLAEDRFRNHGIERVERLPGNIGLLELRSFSRADWVGDKLAAAMTLLADTDALVVDLRRNGGGDPATVALLTSYLLDRRTHLNSLYFRPSGKTQQYWSHDWVPGRRFGGTKPVWVLTSSRTFSGAEEFAYNLQALGRATLVGETTGGGAHPGELRKVGEHFRMFVATGRAINPLTGTNWEGRGVVPELAVAAGDALRVAQLRLLPALRDQAEARGETQLRDALKARQAELEAAGKAGG